MDFDVFRTINWKTTIAAVGFIVCKVVGGLYPPVESVCAILDTIFVGFGLVSAADAGRVQRVVDAVDNVIGVGKETLLIPPTPAPAPAPEK